LNPAPKENTIIKDINVKQSSFFVRSSPDLEFLVAEKLVTTEKNATSGWNRRTEEEKAFDEERSMISLHNFALSVESFGKSQEMTRSATS